MSTDTSSAAAARKAVVPGQGDGRWWTLLAVCGATFMLLVDLTIVQVALPTIQSTLHAGFTSLEWIISGYAVSLAVLILTSGSLADRFGRKRVFMIGVVIFTGASLVCALSGSTGMLIAARVVQGVGGAAMFATSLALIGQEFRGPERGTAIAVWGSTVGGAVAIGPLVGGGLTSALGWQWIFFVNLPVGLATLLIAQARATNVTDPKATDVDWGGLVSFSSALFLLVFGLTTGNDDGWGSVEVLASLAGAAVMLVAFLFIELHNRRPMFDLSLFRKPAFVGVSAATFCIGAGMFGMLPFITLYLQDDLGYSPLQGGLRLLPLTVLAFIVPLTTRRLAARIPAGLQLGTGLALVSVGLLVMFNVQIDSPWTHLLPGLFAAGLGIGIANPVIARIALGVVSPERSGMASGISNTFRVGGVACGVAGLGAIFQQRVATSLTATLARPNDVLAHAVAAGGTRAAVAASHGQAQVVRAAQQAFASGMNVVFFVGAVTVLVGAAATILVRARDLEPGVARPAALE